ncbi:MAG: hypothetical protein WA973_06330 [Mesorhizobium sp.]
MDRHHTAVWAAIDRIAEHRGLTSSGLARLSGLDKTAFNLSKRTSRYGDRWPSTETIAAVLYAVDMTWAEFGRLVDSD